MDVPSTNWAGTITFAAHARYAPTSVEQLQELVARSSRLRVLGSGHSFNAIADTDGDLLSLAALPTRLQLGGDGLTVSGGTRYGEAAAFLQDAGLALGNLASLPHISIGGACATGTHGSGTANASLAAAVSQVEFVRASGELVRLTRDEAEFPGAVVALGRLGVVTALTLDVVPTFELRQYVYEGLPFDRFVERFAEIFATGYSVSAFSDWREPGFRIWVISREDAAPELPTRLGASLADGPRHPVPGTAADNCTVQGGIPGPWHERLPHFRPGFTPSSGQELQSEYLVPFTDGPAAVEAVDRIRTQIAPVLLTSEIRTVAADDLWLSPSSGRATVGLHFTWRKDPAAVRPAVAALESALAPFDARAHWGKVFALDPALVRGQYTHLAEFRTLMERYDPDRTFANPFTDRYLT